jgi:hypothetical protein
MTRPFAEEPQMFRFAQHDMVLLRMTQKIGNRL